MNVLCGVEAWKPLTRLQRMALDRASRLVAISRFTRDGFREANPHFTGRDVDVCHLGVERLAGDDQPPGAPASALIVGRMAGDERYKGHDLLLDIWREVAAAVPGAVLRITGAATISARLERGVAEPEQAGRLSRRIDEEALQRNTRAARRS